jgi:putative membrane protein
MRSKHVFRGICAAGGVLLLAGAAAPGVAAVVTADTGDVQATVRKTVLQTATAEAEILTSRMYTQVTAVGSGTKTVTVPVGVESNRNLNAFGAFPMEGTAAVFELTPDGSQEERILTDADIKPIEVSVKVLLDGQEVAPADLVGADGVVDVQYTVRNTTSRTESVTYTDAKGEEITEDVEVADPFAGSLDVTLPMGFNEITAPGATVAGDGTNQTNLGYTFVLFPPLGATEATVGYQARVTNGQMPAAVFSFLPIVPFDNSTIAGTVEAYRSGAQTGATIAGAGQQIGDNLLKLQEGAGQLLAGLGQLSAGADQLSDGLVNTAAPGSAALADGANQVSDGLSQLNSNVPALADGVEQLDDGAQQLNDGAQQLADGSSDLSDGLTKLQAGIDTLSKGVAALPTTIKQNPGYQQLQGALASVKAGIGAADKQDTLLYAVDRVTKGLSRPGTGPTDPGGILESVGALRSLLVCPADLTALTSPCSNVGALAGPTAPVSVNQITAGIIGGIGSASKPDTLLFAMNRIKLGLSNPNCSLANPTDKANPCGINEVQTLVSGGIDQLVKGISDELLKGIGTTPVNPSTCSPTTLTCASAQLAAGGAQLNAGATQLADGTDQLADGTQELNSRVPTLASGVSQLDDGASQVADGADQLADGLGDAADGSGQLADGLGQAEPGAGQIQDGAGQLKEQGADELVKSGSEAQIGFAADVALLEAQQALGEQGAGIPFGPAEGTDTITTGAIQLQLAGIAADTNNNAVNFVLGGVLLAGAGAAAAFAARRRATA